MAYRKDLLMRAWNRGPSEFLKQSCSILLAAGPIIPIIGFKRDCRDNFRVLDNKGADLCFSNFNQWEDVPAFLSEQLYAFFARTKTGLEVMLERGWRLWTGCRSDKLAIVAWSRSYNVSGDFFFPITEKCVLLWSVETLEGHRGLGIMPLMLDHMVQTLGSEGANTAYLTCSRYNESSRRAIEKAHFKPVGHGIMRARSGRSLVWFPPSTSKSKLTS